MKYYTNRELAGILGVKLAKWKRWSREFLPPDPLGGLQSGYARQYTVKDAFKVYFAGHLISDLKMTVSEARQVLNDLAGWLEDKGYYDIVANGKNQLRTQAQNALEYRIYLFPVNGPEIKGGGFGYRMKEIFENTAEPRLGPDACRQIYTVSYMMCSPEDFSKAWRIRMICISRLHRGFLAGLGLDVG